MCQNVKFYLFIETEFFLEFKLNPEKVLLKQLIGSLQFETFKLFLQTVTK